MVHVARSSGAHVTVLTVGTRGGLVCHDAAGRSPPLPSASPPRPHAPAAALALVGIASSDDLPAPSENENVDGPRAPPRSTSTRRSTAPHQRTSTAAVSASGSALAVLGSDGVVVIARPRPWHDVLAHLHDAGPRWDALLSVGLGLLARASGEDDDDGNGDDEASSSSLVPVDGPVARWLLPPRGRAATSTTVSSDIADSLVAAAVALCQGALSPPPPLVDFDPVATAALSRVRVAAAADAALEVMCAVRRPAAAFATLLPCFEARDSSDPFLDALAAHLADGSPLRPPASTVRGLVDRLSCVGEAGSAERRAAEGRVERVVQRLPLADLDFDQIARLCRSAGLLGALARLYGRGLADVGVPAGAALVAGRPAWLAALLRASLRGRPFPPEDQRDAGAGRDGVDCPDPATVASLAQGARRLLFCPDAASMRDIGGLSETEAEGLPATAPVLSALRAWNPHAAAALVAEAAAGPEGGEAGALLAALDATLAQSTDPEWGGVGCERGGGRKCKDDFDVAAAAPPADPPTSLTMGLASLGRRWALGDLVAERAAPPRPPWSSVRDAAIGLGLLPADETIHPLPSPLGGGAHLLFGLASDPFSFSSSRSLSSPLDPAAVRAALVAAARAAALLGPGARTVAAFLEMAALGLILQNHRVSLSSAALAGALGRAGLPRAAAAVWHLADDPSRAVEALLAGGDDDRAGGIPRRDRDAGRECSALVYLEAAAACSVGPGEECRWDREDRDGDPLACLVVRRPPDPDQLDAAIVLAAPALAVADPARLAALLSTRDIAAQMDAVGGLAHRPGPDAELAVLRVLPAARTDPVLYRRLFVLLLARDVSAAPALIRDGPPPPEGVSSAQLLSDARAAHAGTAIALLLERAGDSGGAAVHAGAALAGALATALAEKEAADISASGLAWSAVASAIDAAVGLSLGASFGQDASVPALVWARCCVVPLLRAMDGAGSSGGGDRFLAWAASAAAAVARGDDALPGGGWGWAEGSAPSSPGLRRRHQLATLLDVACMAALRRLRASDLVDAVAGALADAPARAALPVLARLSAAADAEWGLREAAARLARADADWAATALRLERGGRVPRVAWA